MANAPDSGKRVQAQSLDLLEVLVSDAVQIALIAGATAAIPPMVLGILNYLNGRKVHTLVNSQYGDSLWTGMVAAKALAETKPSDENKMLAGLAQYKYDQHKIRQNRADGKTNE
jgi:hypothetical protein